MSDQPSPKYEQPKMTVLTFRLDAKRHVREAPIGDHSAEIEELPLPEPDRITPAEMLTAVARSPAPDFENAMVVMTTTNEYGEEVMKVFAAGESMSRERMLWICEKIKMRCLGIDVGEDDYYE